MFLGERSHHPGKWQTTSTRDLDREVKGMRTVSRSRTGYGLSDFDLSSSSSK